MAIGERVKQKRIELNISQATLAQMVGIKQQSISDLELGSIEKPRAIVDIARALNCSVEWLYDGNKKATNSN